MSSTDASVYPLDVSLIVPLYNEEDSVPLLVEKVASVMRKTDLSWELICIDDGSRDATAQVLAGLVVKTPELVALYQRRNYGQTAAMQAGFDHARGRLFVTMDGDLQNDPNDIPRMVAMLEKEGADVVSGWRKNRHDDAFRSFLSRQANKLISNITGVPLHDYGCSLKVYRREVFDNMRIYGELHRFIPALLSQYGAKIVETEVTHHARQHGVSKYGNMGRMFRVILDLLAVKFFLKYLHRPMHAFGMTGLMCFIPGVLLSVYLLGVKLMGGSIGQRPLLMLAVLLVLIGVQMLGMGLLGEILVRIYHEPLGRRQYVLRDGPRIAEKPTKKAK